MVRSDKHECVFNCFRATEIRLPVANTNKEVPTENVGPSDIRFKPAYVETKKLQLPYTTMSARIIKDEIDTKVLNNLKNNPPAYAAHVHATIKKEWLRTAQQPTPTFVTEIRYKGQQTMIQYG